MSDADHVPPEVEAILIATKDEHPRITFQRLADSGSENEWPWWRINEWRAQHDSSGTDDNP